MALNFPANPTLDQVYTSGNRSWIWNGTAWIGDPNGFNYTANRVLLGNGANPFQEIAPGTNGNILTSDGTSWSSTPLVVSPTIDGPSNTVRPVGVASIFTITNFDVSANYTLSTANGTVIRSGATITFTPSVVGPAEFTINAKTVTGYTAAVPSIQGPASTNLTVSQVATFTITNYYSDWTYTLSTTNGTVTRSGATISYTPSSAGAAGFTINNVVISGYTAVTGAGQQEYTTSGTYSWVAPAGVTSVCVVCVGSGGTGNVGDFMEGYGGGGGGGLGWKNNISVTPGSTYTVVVGSRPLNGASGGDSYFIDTSTVRGGGGGGSGASSVGGSGGGYTGTGGGNGGRGANGLNAYINGGGGGAGGYAGNGGNGAAYSVAAGSGLGGGGGGGTGGGWAAGSSQKGSGGGGGVGLYGQGSNGAGAPAFTGGSGNGGQGGGGGSGGQPGYDAPAGNSGYGGVYGGGGGAHCNSNNGLGIGGQGAVRIIWGIGRAFPSTNTQNV